MVDIHCHILSRVDLGAQSIEQALVVPVTRRGHPRRCACARAMVRQMRSARNKPILAHPERHQWLGKESDQIECPGDQELHCQITTGSILSRLGPGTQPRTFVERGWVIGSDVQDTESRPSGLRRACTQVQQWAGTAEA